jgi:hypothetical protein
MWRKLLTAVLSNNKNVLLMECSTLRGNLETELIENHHMCWVLQWLKQELYIMQTSESNDFNTGSIEINGLIQTEIDGSTSI